MLFLVHYLPLRFVKAVFLGDRFVSELDASESASLEAF